MKKIACALTIAILTIAVSLISLSVFAELVWGGKFNREMDSVYVPTAQTILKNSAETPIFLRIEPPPGNVYNHLETICVDVYTELLPISSDEALGNATEIILNGQRVSRRDVIVGYTGTLNVPIVRFCLNPELKTGLYLLEIRLKTTLSGEEVASYTWVYELK